MAGLYSNAAASASSSTSPPNRGAGQSSLQLGRSRGEDNDDLDDLLSDNDLADIDVLAEDPIRGSLEEPMSFKRKQKPGMLSSSARFLSAIAGRPSNPASPHSGSRTGTPSRRGDGFASPSGAHIYNESSKDGAPPDWYIEGPGRRVAYDDLTAIDWIFEYTKERQRLRVLDSNSNGLVGVLQRFADASQVWVILILTGLAVGALAAGINITTDWLADLKTGYCSSGPEGGAFYLNKAFCCWGYEEASQCQGWTPWAQAVGISSTQGKWILEYIVFLFFSVHWPPVCPRFVARN